MAVLNGVLCYTRVDNPAENMNGKLEYKTSIVVSKADADEWKKTFKKQLKMLENEEFTTKFKIDPPFPKQPMQYVITLTQGALYKDGTPKKMEHRPKLYLRDGEFLKDVTMSCRVGNGSKGAVQYSSFTSAEYGVFGQLDGIRIDTLVERPGGPVGVNELGNVANNSAVGEPETDIVF